MKVLVFLIKNTSISNENGILVYKFWAAVSPSVQPYSWKKRGIRNNSRKIGLINFRMFTPLPAIYDCGQERSLFDKKKSKIFFTLSFSRHKSFCHVNLTIASEI